MLLVVFVPAVLLAGQQDSQRSYTLPVLEAEKILDYWLTDSGFEVAKITSAAGNIQLSAIKGHERWQITLKTSSPLASAILAVYTLNDQPDQMKVKEMWDFIDGYSKGLYLEKSKNPVASVPPAVLYHKKSVVCIRAGTMTKTKKTLQFSGFIIDKEEGIIISTAHDLEGVRDVRVALDDGREIKGKIKKMDTDRDLTLIKIDPKVNSVISLANSRNLLDNGERVFFIGCPMNHQGMVQSGTIDGLPRSVNSHPLWQVHMETLPGSSGSPVFDINGNLTGIIKGRYRGTDSRGFVITMETIMEFLGEK